MSEIQFQPTANEWDAPIALYQDDDAVSHVRRDLDPLPGFDWTHRTMIPHGVVLVDGVMSPFDAARQPTARRPRACGKCNAPEGTEGPCPVEGRFSGELHQWFSVTAPLPAPHQESQP